MSNVLKWEYLMILMAAGILDPKDVRDLVLGEGPVDDDVKVVSWPGDPFAGRVTSASAMQTPGDPASTAGPATPRLPGTSTPAGSVLSGKVKTIVDTGRYWTPDLYDKLDEEVIKANFWLGDPWLSSTTKEALRQFIEDAVALKERARGGGPPAGPRLNAVCTKCNLVNEYAEPAADYVCYECRR